MLPVDPQCGRSIENGVASMEFRASGPRPLTLVGPRGLCVITGFVYERPPPLEGEEPVETEEPAAAPAEQSRIDDAPAGA